MYPRWTAASYARLPSSNEHQCLGFVVLAPNPDGWSGRLVHLTPVHFEYQSTQFGIFLSSRGICSKIGERYFGGFLGSACAFAEDFFTNELGFMILHPFKLQV